MKNPEKPLFDGMLGVEGVVKKLLKAGMGFGLNKGTLKKELKALLAGFAGDWYPKKLENALLVVVECGGVLFVGIDGGE